MAVTDLSVFQLIVISIFGFIFGGFETTTNMFYLISRNYRLPRKQHSRELPENATQEEVLHKVVQMLILGVCLLILAFISIVIAPQLFVVGATAILVSGMIDYSKFKKNEMLVIWILIAILISVCLLLPTKV
ncbi:MAG: hypothetical protein ACFFAJ_15550 [Candidatus Hodarchaeota archaeon]